ncbi:LysM peptidoglycan-binding domain-containing protein [Bacillus sp. DJP31]|uniref:LysM peptidoglycan-binding domain-containing protein n=1 Tax=Bacillus sp. DJP31 TaxID=3409789 RepID=UPI003BB7EAA9
MSDSIDQFDQAKLLRERMNLIQNNEPVEKEVLSLPPRKTIHHAKDEKKKTKIKLKYPIVRLLALLFILLPIAILGYTYHQNNQLPASNSLSQNQSSSREEISIGTKQEPKKGIEKEPEEVIVEEPDIQDPPQKKEDTPVSETNTSDLAIKPDSEQEASSSEIDEKQYDIVFHTVKDGETLYSISQQYYSSRSGEEILKKWNGLNNNQVENGQRLEIPIKPSK